jgi:gamma-glutamyltranspeptidase
MSDQQRILDDMDDDEETDPLVFEWKKEETEHMGTIGELHEERKSATESSTRSNLPPRHPSPLKKKNGKSHVTPRMSNSSVIKKKVVVEKEEESPSNMHRRTRSNGADPIQFADPFQTQLHPDLQKEIDATSYQRSKPRQGTKKIPNSLMHHLSYIMRDDSSDLSDEMQSPNFQLPTGRVRPRGSGFQISNQKKGIKRMLLLLTAAFVVVAIAHRNYQGPAAALQNSTNADFDDDDSITKAKDQAMITDFCMESVNEHELMELQNKSSVEQIASGAVSTDDQRCSEMGVSVMRDMNGNAMDAAVTTTLCLGLVNPASSGIGGGAFILVHSSLREGFPLSNSNSTMPYLDRRQNRDDLSFVNKSEKRTEVIDCRESAPTKATFDMFEKLPLNASTLGTLSIAVPGELRGLEIAHARFGSLSWKEVLQPVIDLGEKGVTVSKFLAKEIFDNKEAIDQYEATRLIFTKNNDGTHYLEFGDLMTRPSYTSTLKNIALHGADYIYSGAVAETIAKEIKDAGGIISAKDIENYKPILRDPLIAQVSGLSIASVPPPSSGGATVIGTLRFLSGYDNPFASFAGALSTHRFVEALKHVFAIRMSLSDPDFFTNVTESAVSDLISGPFMEQLRRKTLDETVLPLSDYGGKWALINSTDDKGDAKDAREGDRRRLGEDVRRRTRLFNYLEDHGTTHINIVDKDRNAVAITSSVNYYFGSTFASPSTGIVFNNVMDDFATPGRPNTYGKLTVRYCHCDTISITN